MSLTESANQMARDLSRLEDRLLNLNPNDVDKRYRLFSIAMDKCTHFENQLGHTGVSLLEVMEKNRLSTGEELYSYLYSELPPSIDGKSRLSDIIEDAAHQIAEIQDSETIYYESDETGNIHPATNAELRAGFDRLIKACYVAAAKASIK